MKKTLIIYLSSFLIFEMLATPADKLLQARQNLWNGLATNNLVLIQQGVSEGATLETAEPTLEHPYISEEFTEEIKTFLADLRSKKVFLPQQDSDKNYDAAYISTPADRLLQARYSLWNGLATNNLALVQLGISGGATLETALPTVEHPYIPDEITPEIREFLGKRQPEEEEASFYIS